jgi:hypothetical protein
MSSLTDDILPATVQPADHPSVRLKDLVLQYEICFESYPSRQFSPEHELIMTGYELDLLGTAHASLGPLLPGGAAWRSVHRALLLIAREILPREEGESRCSITPCHFAIEFSPRRKMRRDVVVAIDINSRRGRLGGPPNDGPLHCLHEMQSRLLDLGARADRW